MSRTEPDSWYRSGSERQSDIPSCCISSLAGLEHVGLVGFTEHLVANLGVGDGTMLLPQVQPQLALVPEVQVTLLTTIRFLSSVYA